VTEEADNGGFLPHSTGFLLIISFPRFKNTHPVVSSVKELYRVSHGERRSIDIGKSINRRVLKIWQDTDVGMPNLTKMFSR